jgi:putative DNA primase/helicase
VGLFLLASKTNHKPKVDGNDPALWHRLLLIPFVLTFVENPKLPHERKRDKHLMDRLLKESSGILAWLYQGFRQWQEQGLNPPEKVMAATNEYRAENNSIMQFLSECCLVMPGVRCKPIELFTAYQQFCIDAGLEQDNQQSFYAEMKNKFERGKGRERRCYLGVALKAEFEA